jgi:hypothetical protein
MTDPTIPKVNLEQIEADERHEKIRNRILITLVLLIGLGVAVWVGSLINHQQATTDKAEAKTEQAQVEKFNLAQQVAAACASPDLDDAQQEQLCKDARTIVREGPQGAQGIPGPQGNQGVQGIQGIPGFDGKPGANGVDGKPGTNGTNGTNGLNGKDGLDGQPGPAGADGADGATGPQGPAGKDGADGAVGPMGPAGKDGEPPFSWIVFDEDGHVIQECKRTPEPDFDPAAPTYECREPAPQ